MVLRSVPDCLDSDIWSQNDMQESVFKPSEESMLRPCSRPGLLDRRQKPNVDQAALKCPRCDSSNTKFCYYNNYSLSQPRYFCKTCRRYWTNGGSLRNVPVGGGCRKNKRAKRTGDQPVNCNVQNIEPTTSTSTTNNNNEFNRCSSNLDQTSLPAFPSVYFSILNEGADGLGVGYTGRSLHQQQALRVADQSLLRGNCNSSAGILEISATSSEPTSLLPPLPNLPNLNSLLKSANLITGLDSPRIRCSRADQGAAASIAVPGDLRSIFEAQVAASNSSTAAILKVSDGFNDTFGLALHGSRLNSDHQIHDNDFQWQMQQQLDQQRLIIPADNHATEQVMLPYINETNGAEELGQHHDLKLRQLFMTNIPSSLGKAYDENRPGACNWQLPALSEGLLDTSGNNIGYWNGAGLPDFSSYSSFTNSLI